MTLKVGVIGTGAIGQDHIRRITRTLSGASIVAVMDVDKEQANKVVLNEKLAAKIYNSGHDLINAADVDVVLVTSWGPSHEEFVLASIAAGKSVFCEKPLATTAEGCRRIVEAEVAHGKQLVQVGYMRRYDKGYRALKNCLDSGVLGDTLMVHCIHRNATIPDFFVGDMPITDSLVHEIDVLRWLLNDDYVSAQVVLPKKSRFANPQLQDPHMILLETSQGVRIDVEVFLNCQYGYDIQCQVVGEKGAANLPEPSSVLMRSEAKVSREILTDWKERFIESYDTELQDWINSTVAGEMNGPSAWDGYVAAMTADACVEAKKTGGIVPISLMQRPPFYDYQYSLSGNR